MKLSVSQRVPFYIPISNVWAFSSSTSLTTLSMVSHLRFSNCDSYVAVSHFNFHFPNDCWSWASFHVLIYYPCVLCFFKIYFYIYFWLCWVFVSVRGLSLVAASGGHSSSRCAGLSLSRPLLLRTTGSRRAGSVVVAHGPSCSAACGIFPDQGSNSCPLHWQADSQPLRHQGSPMCFL